MNKKRTTILFCVLAGVTIIAIAGWAAGSRIESPAEAAAKTAPPTPSPILVPVEQRILSSKVVTRGTARFGLPVPINIAPSTLKPASGLITRLPLRNAQFKEGDVLLTASGRPVFVLKGDVPGYRDLVPGISGEDVRQLKQGLKRLGFDPGLIDGVYDGKTSEAVSQWYKSAGWEPFGPTSQQIANVRALEQSLADAKKSKLAAESAAVTADMAVESARMKAAYSDKAADSEIAAKIADRALIVLDPRQLATARMAAEAKLDLARVALKSSKLDGGVTVQSALDAQKLTKLDVQLTTERVNQLAADLDLAKSKLGVQIPLDEIVFIPSLPVRVQDVMVRVGNPASGPVMSVTDNQIAIDSSLPLDESRLVKPGMKVQVDEQSFGINTTGVVERVASTPGTNGVDGYHIYFEVRVGESPTPLEGFSLRLTIPIESTKGMVIAVPVSAVSLAADGTSRIQIENQGAFDYVKVKPGMAADGFVEVTPIEGSLKPGQLVVVGNKTPDSQP